MPERPADGVRRRPMWRWLTIVNAFLVQDEWGVRDLAAAVGIPRSAVHRVLHDMVSLGLLALEERSGHFSIGPELTRIGVLVAERVDITRAARPVMTATLQEFGETVVLLQYSRARRQFWAIDTVESDQAIRYVWESLRTWRDLYRGCSGKGILAFLPEDEREAIIAALPEPIPGAKDSTQAGLRAELDQARSQGYVVTHGERYAGAIGAAAPIRDAKGTVVGDLAIFWPDSRTSAEKEARAAVSIVRAAAEVSARMGYREG